MRLLVFVLLTFISLYGQKEYPKDYFRSPLNIPLLLSGNFGELRPNHFHSGVDFKTQQKEGLPIYAVADGYVARIKVSTFGNGKTLYIAHPNGFTSVYAHLQKANGLIEAYIKKAHYRERSFELELYLKPGELVVNKDDIIAFSGNTGGSEGPHLHFEFRDTATENIINPLHFGFDNLLKDTKKPAVYGVYVYPIGTGSIVNQSKKPLLLNLSLQKDGTYIADKVIGSGKIGFGVNAYDFDDISFNKNGIYKIETALNGQLSFGYQFDTFSFQDLRFINALIDYSLYKRTGQRIQKLFRSTPYNFGLIKTSETNGVIEILPNLNMQYRIEVLDFYGNKTVINVPIVGQSLPVVINEEPTAKYFVKHKNDMNFEKDGCSVFFPESTFYDDFSLNFDVKDNILNLHTDVVPAHKSFIIQLENKKFSEAQLNKVFIGSFGSGKIGYNPTIRKENVFSTKVKALGKYGLVLDQSPPKISSATPITGKSFSGKKTIQLFISDDLSGIKSYNGYLNDQWILFEYDSKTKKITHNFSDGIVADGQNQLKVVVEDNVGNTVIFETQFFRSQTH